MLDKGDKHKEKEEEEQANESGGILYGRWVRSVAPGRSNLRKASALEASLSAR